MKAVTTNFFTMACMCSAFQFANPIFCVLPMSFVFFPCLHLGGRTLCNSNQKPSLLFSMLIAHEGLKILDDGQPTSYMFSKKKNRMFFLSILRLGSSTYGSRLSV